MDERVGLLDGRVLGWAASGDPAGTPVLYLHGAPGSRVEAGPRSAFGALRAAAGPGVGRGGAAGIAPEAGGIGEAYFDEAVRAPAALRTELAHLAARMRADRLRPSGRSWGRS